MNTNWHELKEHIYFEDGSLRDIYAFDINLEDWKKWVDFVNQHYEVKFVFGGRKSKTSLIEFSKVKAVWSDTEKFVNRSTVKIGELNINCHFFQIDEFENDISPKEFKTLSDHKLLIEYMKKLSQVFNRKIFLTLEGAPQFVLIEVSESEILLKYEK